MSRLFFFLDFSFSDYDRYLSAASVSDRDDITWAGQVKF